MLSFIQHIGPTQLGIIVALIAIIVISILIAKFIIHLIKK